MRDPIRQLRQLPWAETFSSAGFAFLLVIALEAAVVFGLGRIEAIAPLLGLLLQGNLGYVIVLLVAVLVGALAVVILERFSSVRPQASVLWALVGSMMVLLVVRSLLASVVPPLFLSASFECLMALTIGVFWKGRPYW